MGLAQQGPPPPKYDLATSQVTHLCSSSADLSLSVSTMAGSSQGQGPSGSGDIFQQDKYLLSLQDHLAGLGCALQDSNGKKDIRAIVLRRTSLHSKG